MSKVPQLILDDSVLTSVDLKTKKIDSMTNKAYQKNIPVVRKVIEKNNQKYAEAQLRAAKLIVKSFDKDGPYSHNEKIAEIQRLANRVKSSCVNEIVLNRILDASIELISQEEFYTHTVDIRNLKKGKSNKLYNIQFNLKYCFELINDAYIVGKNAIDKKYFELILSILFLFIELEKVTTISIDYLDAIIVSVLAKFGRKIDEGELVSLVLKNDALKSCEYNNITPSVIYSSLSNLYKLKIIENVDGFVQLIEKVLL